MKNKLFLGRKAMKKERKAAVDIISSSMGTLQQFCHEKDIDLRYIIHPTSSQVSPKRNLHLRFNQDDIQKAFERSSPLSDLDNDQLEITYNLFPTLIDSLSDMPYKSYAWPINGHYNPFGYGVFAEQVYEMLNGDGVFGE